jgi:hypothetical protein
MFELFRYVEWHAPSTVDSPDAITIEGDTELRAALRAARSEDDAAEKLAQLATEFAASPGYALGPEGLASAAEYTNAIELAGEIPDEELPHLADRLAELFDGVDLQVVAASAQFREDKLRIGDSLIAAKILGAEREQDFPKLLEAARAIALLERVAASDPLVTTRAGLDRVLNALVVIPDDVLLLGRGPAAPADQPAPVPVTDRLRVLDDRREQLQSAVTFLASLAATDFAPATALAQDRPLTPQASNLANLQPARGLFGSLFRRVLRAPGTTIQTSIAADALILQAETRQRLPAGVREALAAAELDPTRTSVPAMIDRLHVELEQIEQERNHLAPFDPAPVYQLGQYFFVLSGGAGPSGAPAPFLGDAPDVKIRPVGFGDLQVVKQQIVRYEAGEVSYVENILKGEEYKRSVQRRELEEEIVVSERERIKEEERDLQATDRFELRTESENTARNTATTTAGNTVTTQYGALVETRGSTFARDVVNRTVNKLTERVREQRTVRIQREIVDKTGHLFNNVEGDGHVSGVYQWIDKVYEAQVFNFGKRLLYEAIIPEPAAFLIEMRKKSGRPETMELQRPPDPTFGPLDLNAWNYWVFARRYDVVGAVEPPPAEYVTVPFSTKDVQDTDGSMYVKHNIPIPPGYGALHVAYVWTMAHKWPSASYYVIIGSNLIYQSVASVDTRNPNGALAGETDWLPLSIAGYETVRLNLIFSIVCQRQPVHLERWQLRTYETLMKGYKRQKEEYEERLANMQALMRAQMLLGGGSRQNRQTEEVELKKAFLSILTNQHFDVFDAVQASTPDAYPEADISAAAQQSGFVSFFERAFEWQNMLYFFYPYFWGRKAEWDERVMIQDSDPQFEAFLKAGAVRVVVPVRPGFEGAVAHYVETGQVWLGEDEPNMYSQLFVSILQEIKDRDRAPGDEVAVGEPWEVRLPTTLVRLRGDDELPTWEKDADGTWQPKP